MSSTTPEQGAQLDLLALAAQIPGELDVSQVLHQLQQWVEVGWLRALDRALVLFLLDMQPDADPLTLLAAALASHQLGHGHVCLELHETLSAPDLSLSLPPEGQQAGQGVQLPSDLLRPVSAECWLRALAASSLVDSLPGADSQRPLVLHGSRLYLRRYWNYERQVAANLRQRLATPLPLPDNLAAQLDELFPLSDQLPDWQKLACALAARGAFSIITGGPGR